MVLPYYILLSMKPEVIPRLQGEQMARSLDSLLLPSTPYSYSGRNTSILARVHALTAPKSIPGGRGAKGRWLQMELPLLDILTVPGLC